MLFILVFITSTEFCLRLKDYQNLSYDIFLNEKCNEISSIFCERQQTE